MEQSTRRVPRYLQIAEELRTELLRQPEGTPVATEQALTERFSVSRGTVRQAIALLTQEGVVYRMQGSGTFRAKQNQSGPAFIVEASSIQRIWEVGQARDFSDLSFTTVRAENVVADALQIPHGTKVRRIYRVRTINGRPFAIGIAYARVDILKRMPKHPSLNAMLEMVQEDSHLSLRERRCICSAVSANETDASVLHVVPGTALLQFQFTAMMTGIGPFIIDTFRFVPDYTFCMESCMNPQME